MFGEIKEKLTHDTIQEALENIAEELGCSFKDVYIVIKPINETFTMKFYIYKTENNVQKFIREITLTEILNT
jgi:hypothetical protein